MLDYKYFLFIFFVKNRFFPFNSLENWNGASCIQCLNHKQNKEEYRLE